MSTVQPVLIPATGTLADLHVNTTPDSLYVYWGTALLQVVPRDKNSLLFRIGASFLLNLNFRIGSVAKAFGVSEKPLRVWRDALKNGNWSSLGGDLDHLQQRGKLRRDVKRYIRVSYRQVCDDNHGQMPYGFRKQLCEQVVRIWPDQEVCEETLRQLFRDEDAIAHSGNEVPTEKEKKQTWTNSVDEAVDLGSSFSHAVSITEELERLSSIEDNTDNRKLPPDSVSDLSSNDPKNRELDCDYSHQFSSPKNPSKTEATLPIGGQGGPPPNQACFPLLSSEQPGSPFMSQHAGILLLAPEFDEAFNHLPPILRQTAAQILTGCVNQEQAKLIDYKGLRPIVGKVIRDLERQRTLLDLLAEKGMEELVYEGNIRLLKLQSIDELIIYGDTHHSEYTGCERIILGWSGLQKKALRGIMMEFFHTLQGEPCMVGHYDNFYDGRQRFFLLRERFVKLLQPWSGHFVWVHDRGYWGYDFLRQIVECGDMFIQWEKNYKEDGWDESYQKDGKFSMTLQGNSSQDQRKQIKVKWREQKWNRFTNGRRIIVRVKRASGKRGEVAIVTNHPTMTAEKVIQLMLRRFLQENDFSYLNRHVGINELTARKFDRYQAIAHELQDREGDSRAYKKTKKQQLALQEKLKQCLFKLDGMPEVSFATLEKQRTRLRQKADRLNAQLDALNPTTVADSLLSRLSRTVRELKDKFRQNSDQRRVAEARRIEEAKRHQLHQEIDTVKKQLAQLSRTESRLLMYIEENYVRPNMDRKALVDALRITSRNTFCQVLQDFRPYYDNYRDDHVVLRALTYAGGIIIPHADRIDVYLLPRLHRQAKEWERIAVFLREREKVIKKRFEKNVRFILGQSFPQIVHAVNRSAKQGNGRSE